MSEANEANPSIDDDRLDGDTLMVVAAFNPVAERVYLHVGPNEQDYPVEFHSARGDEQLLIDDEVDRIFRKAMVGMEYYAAPVDSGDGRELLYLERELIESDDDLKTVLERRVDVLEDEVADR